LRISEKNTFPISGFFRFIGYIPYKAAGKHRIRKRALLQCVGVILCCVWLSARNANGAESAGRPEYEFNIPAQPLVKSLNILSNKTETLVLFPYDLVKDRTSHRVQGRFTVRQALEQMLQNTGLEGGVSKTGVLMISQGESEKTSITKGVDMGNKNKLSSSIVLAMSSLAAAQAAAQEASNETLEEILVTGVRGSLERAMDIKRQSSGVVDAISAEEMGKFPDTNLAESLQRITGVSINRVNGEGSEVTVRGFAGDFNMVTLNGRQIPSANVANVEGDVSINEIPEVGTTRSFDFSNLAAEGVQGLQVYKTGRADVPAGGIGATINVDTVRPLERPGLNISLGAKAMHDTSNGEGDEVTPELSGLFSWTDNSEKFGISLFGSFQERDFGNRGQSVQQVFIREAGPNLDSDFGLQNAEVINRPEDGTLVAMPSSTTLGVIEGNRERINGMLTLQFRPVESLTLTGDATYAQNKQQEQAFGTGIWFAQQFTRVEFDGNPKVASPVILQEDIDGGKDFFTPQRNAKSEDTLESYGFNADWQVTDRLNLTLDAHTSEAESAPDGAFGNGVNRFSVAGAIATFQTAEFPNGLQQANIVIDDSVKGNNNGVFDFPDLGTQVIQQTSSLQKTELDQFRLDGTYDLRDETRLGFGAGFIDTEMRQVLQQREFALGGWGVENPGDIPEGLLEEVCVGCSFQDSDVTGVEGAPGVVLGEQGFKGNAVTLTRELVPEYGGEPGNLPLITDDDNLVEEEIWSAYIQLDTDFELGGFPANLVVGGRYERTEVESTGLFRVPREIVWESDDDFRIELSDEERPISGNGNYTNVLPNLDLSIDVRDDLKVRFSASKTLARPNYGDLTSTVNVGDTTGLTLQGERTDASRGNPDLDPLVSDNIDLSVEWYYGESSFLSVGFYDKRISNFVGTQQETETLFGIRDQTAGTPGTRLAEALEALENLGVTPTERNLFTMTAIIDNPESFPDGPAEFEESQAFADMVFSTYDVRASSDDPLRQFEVQSPNNSEDAKIHGFEIASQHFFGDSGFGFQANFTSVSGDIGFRPDSSPLEDQFALEGLSDTANFVFIYEKYGLSVRAAFNWRDAFLDEVVRPGSVNRNPVFVDDFHQWDLNIAYDITDNLEVTFEGVNLNQKGVTRSGRTRRNIFSHQELDSRFLLGARYTF